jgi:attachment p12 family protein
MSSSLQTIIALAIVALAIAWLIYNAMRKRHSSSCGGGECGAISPEIKKLQARLKR